MQEKILCVFPLSIFPVSAGGFFMREINNI
nr:MAG TPA: hypothetical protein [Caudoviricetes sp.]